MSRKSRHNDPTAGQVLHAHLHGVVPFEDSLALQRRLVYHVSGTPGEAAVILCEHSPIITVGREGSRTHILYEAAELARRQWPVRWVNRGGGCILHAPGQLAIYSIMRLEEQPRSLTEYLDKLHRAMIGMLREFEIRGTICPRHGGILVGEKLIAAVGVAVRSWVTYYGAFLNLNPDLEWFRGVKAHSHHEDGAMTSVERERRGRVRPSHVRERLLEHMAAEFAFARTSVIHDSPGIFGKTPTDAIPSTR